MMRGRILRLVLMALLVPAIAGAAFVQFGEAGYKALQEASQRAGNKGWVADRLKKNEPLSETVAKEEAKVLLLNKHLDPYYVKALKDAFPQEMEAVEVKYPPLDEKMKVLDDQISVVTAKLDRFEAGMRDGLLSGRSRPSLLGSLGGSMVTVGNWHGPGGRHLYWRDVGGSGIWTEWSLADDGFNLTWVMEFYVGYIDFRDAHLGLAFDNPFLPGIEMVIADENNYPALSLLVFNGGGDGFDDDFSDIGSLSGRKELIKSSAGYGARGSQDIYIRRKSSGDWWPFSDTQLVMTQTNGYFFGAILNDVCANFKIRGMPMFWPFERADPSITTLWTFNDTAEINSYKNQTVPNNSSAQSLAFNMLLVGGGTFYLEAATAEWEKADVAKAYRDFAVSTVLSKSIGPMALVLDYQHTGPDYFPGTQDEPSGNAASSLATIKVPDPAGGPDIKQQVWKTVASEPTGPTTNSEHLSVGTTIDLGSASIGVAVGSNVQIQPSGFLLTTRHMIGFPWDKLKNNGGAHGFEIGKDNNIANLKQYTQAYDNRATQFAVLDGKSVILPDVLPAPDPNFKSPDDYGGRWTTLDSNNRESIVLTKHGIGDNELRGDSVKYVNFIDLRGDINFQSLFDLEKPCLLKLASRLRNTEESFSIPTYTDSSMLMQIASSATFNVSMPGKTQMVTAVGYEDWLSKASYLPIEYHTEWALFQFWKDFPQFINDFTMGPSVAVMKHQDPNNDQRDFSAWVTWIGASTTF